MLSVTRSYETLEIAACSGAPVALYMRQLSVNVRARNISLGASYARPSGVARAGEACRVSDVVMIVRLAALLAVLLVKVGRSVRQ